MWSCTRCPETFETQASMERHFHEGSTGGKVARFEWSTATSGAGAPLPRAAARARKVSEAPTERMALKDALPLMKKGFAVGSPR